MEQDNEEMSENLVVPEDTQIEEAQTTLEQQKEEEKPVRKRTYRKRTSRKKADKLETKTCKVLHYNAKQKILDIDFDGYGIRLKDVKKRDVTSDEVAVQYKGEIGKPDFQCKLGSE